MDVVSSSAVATVAGAGAASFFVNLVRSFLRIDGQLTYWKKKAGEYDGEGRNGVEGSGSEIGNPILEMESRINDRLDFLEKRTGCEFSEIFQGHLKCLHDLRASEALSARELIDAIDENILHCSHLLAMLKTYEISLLTKEPEDKKDG